MDSNLFNLLLVITTLAITIIGTFLTNFLKQKIGADKTTAYYEAAKQIVMAIEQLNPELAGTDKKEIAITKLLEFTNNKLTSEQADTLIESAVYEIKKLLQ